MRKLLAIAALVILAVAFRGGGTAKPPPSLPGHRLLFVAQDDFGVKRATFEAEDGRLVSVVVP